MTLPLDGITVLDLSRLLPGPLCSLHLKDMGARVIKVEDTGAGDYARTLGMPNDMISPVFHILNRGKESISVDLATPTGKQLLLKLVAQADVLLESFRPEVMDKLGLGYDILKQANPKLVMCALSGYGQTGPWALKAGHDINYCALAGVLDQTGAPFEAPVLSNFQVADIAGGALSAAMAILGGVIGQLRHGKGCYLDISMTDCAFANHIIPLAALNLTGEVLPRGQDMLTGARPCYGVYPTKDNKYMALAALEKKFWEKFCAAVDQPQWCQRYQDNDAAADQLRHEITTLFSSQPQAFWRDLFAEHDCCVTPILTTEEAFQHPQLLAREMIQTISTGQGSQIHCPAPAVAFNGNKTVTQAPGPDQGQHTYSILRQVGCSETEIQQWLTQRIVYQSPTSTIPVSSKKKKEQEL